MPGPKDLLVWIGAGALGGLVVAALMGAAAQAQKRQSGRAVEAQAFVVRDRAGVTRGRFEWRPENDEVQLVLLDNKGVTRITTNVRPDGTLALALGGENEPGRIELARTRDGKAAVRLRRRESTAAIESLPAGGSVLVLEDQLGVRRGSFGVSADGAPALEIRDAEEKVVFRAPAQ
jgi:hypothetical protein